MTDLTHEEAGPTGLETTGLSAQRASAWARYLPLIFFQLYLTSSLVAFRFGPARPEIADWGLLISYALVGQLLILVGYLLGALWRGASYSGRFPPMFLLGVAILVALALLPGTLSSRNYADVSLVEAVLNPGAAYEAFGANFRSVEGVRTLSVFRTLLGPIVGLLIPLGIVYWRRMTASWRILWLAALFGKLGEAMISGTAFYLFDILLVVPWFLWLSVAGRPSKSSSEGAQWVARRKRRIRRAALGIASVAIVLIGLWYFSYSRLSRYAHSWGVHPFAIGWSEELYGVPLPQPVEFGSYFVLRYWTQGYEGLAGCLELPFEWSGGLGHSVFLSRYAARISNDLKWIEPSSYPARLDTVSGYRVDQYWHTIYPWLASDLTFPGAWICIGVLAFMLAATWSDALRDRNPFALGFLGQLLLLFFYIPANNIRLGSPEAALTFWGLLVLWLLTRVRSDVAA